MISIATSAINSMHMIHQRITKSNQMNSMTFPSQVQDYAIQLKQEEEKQFQKYSQIKKDEELAKLIQSLEVKDSSNSSSSQIKKNISEDEKLCYMLLKEEKLKEEQKKLEESKRRQIEEDAKLARQIEIQNRSYLPPNPPPIPHYSSGIKKHGYTVYPQVQITSERRQHALQTHNMYCFCGKTATYNNNHIFDIHKKYCGCELFPVHNYWNEGKKHQHDMRCCTMNHMHTINCRCSYRDHVHDHLCCGKFHNHLVTCHCSQK